MAFAQYLTHMLKRLYVTIRTVILGSCEDYDNMSQFYMIKPEQTTSLQGGLVLKSRPQPDTNADI